MLKRKEFEILSRDEIFARTINSIFRNFVRAKIGGDNDVIEKSRIGKLKSLGLENQKISE